MALVGNRDACSVGLIRAANEESCEGVRLGSIGPVRLKNSYGLDYFK
jgi:hypothetical protein